MPRKSNLILSEQQERELVDYALQRAASLQADNQERIAADKRSWQAYENDVKYREGDNDTIFKLSNLHVPLTAMTVEYFMARAEEAVVDEAPYFNFAAVGASDAQRARAYNQYYNWKLDTKGRTFSTLQDGMLPIFVQRATIFKSTFADDKSRWMESGKEVLHDSATGQPVQILGLGVVIRDEDAFDTVADPVGPIGPNGNPPTMQRLRADPSFVFDPSKHEWKSVTLRREETLYRGPRSVMVDYDRFLCPNNAVSVDAADVVGELHDQDLAWFRNMWLDGRPWEAWQNAEAMFQSGDASAKTDGEAKRDTKENLSFDIKNPRRKVLELWIRRDVLGWGVPQEFVIFIDVDSRKAIFYEFQAKVCPDARRPYTVIAVGKTKNRWWGKSIPEKVEQYQLEADKQFNAEAYRNKIRANPFKGGDKSALKNPDQDLDSDPNAYFELKSDRKIEEVFQFSTLPDLDDRTQLLVDYIIRMVQLWLGVSNIAQGDYNDLPQNDTKYGIEATLREASKISKRWIRRIIRGFEEHVLKLVQVAMATLPENAVETYEFAEGKTRMLDTLTAQEIRSVEVNVTLRMRQHQGSDQIERAKSALDVQSRYLATPPQLQQFVRPLLADILEELGYKDVDKLLPQMPNIPVEPVGAPPDQTKDATVVPAAMPDAVAQPKPVEGGEA